MATQKLNAEQFAAMDSKTAGIFLVYPGKEGKDSAQFFYGDDYVPQKLPKGSSKKAQEDELFRVWKNIVKTMWETKREELKLRQDNDGIRSKFRASTPCCIIVRNTSGDLVKRFELDESVWAKIGLVPTAKDIARLEDKTREYNKEIHKATKASFDALKFRVDLAAKQDKDVEQVLENAVQQANEVLATVAAETTELVEAAA